MTSSAVAGSQCESKRGAVPRVPAEIIAVLPSGHLRDVIEGRTSASSDSVRVELEQRYADRLEEAPEFRSLTTSSIDRKEPVARWFFYKEGFSSQLVKAVLEREGIRPGHRVLDPFGGVGTVPFLCQTLGIDAVAVDRSPLPVFISNTKLRLFDATTIGEIHAILTDMIDAIRSAEPAELPDVSIWSKGFDQEVAHGLLASLKLIKAKRVSGTYSEEACDLAHLAILGVAEEVSHTVKDGTSLRLRPPGRRLGRAGVKKSADDLVMHLKRMIDMIVADIASMRTNADRQQTENRVANMSVVGDARLLTNLFEVESFDLVITSPPYANRYDYSSIYSLELLLGFVNDRRELRELRFELFRSHLEAPWPSGVKGLTPAVQEVLANFWISGMSSPRVFKMILGYFSDLAETLEQLKIVLKKQGAAYFVVGNVRVEGQEIPVDLMLGNLAEHLGFKVRRILVARYKGTNSQQSKKFGSARLRESIVIIDA